MIIKIIKNYCSVGRTSPSFFDGSLARDPAGGAARQSPDPLKSAGGIPFRDTTLSTFDITFAAPRLLLCLHKCSRAPATVWWRNYDIMLSRFHRIPKRDGQTDGRTDGQNCYINNRTSESLHYPMVKTACSYVTDYQRVTDRPTQRDRQTDRHVRRSSPKSRI